MNPQAVHSALEPGGVQAAHILRLFYAYLDVARGRIHPRPRRARLCFRAQA